ncbi:MAG: outer membrane beta-barrel protein, partial [Bacteroidota bacterium]
MLRVFSTLSLLFPLLLVAQSEPVNERSVGVEIGAHNGNRRISGGSGVTFFELERQDSLESGAGGLSYGILYEVRANKVGFTTGARYLQTGYDIAQQPFFNDPTQSFSDEVRAQYLSIPFELNFHQSITQKDRVSFMLGIAAQVHLKTTRMRTIFVDGVEDSTVEVANNPDLPFRSPIVSLHTGIAFDRKLGEDWALK